MIEAIVQIYLNIIIFYILFEMKNVSNDDVTGRFVTDGVEKELYQFIMCNYMKIVVNV